MIAVWMHFQSASSCSGTTSDDSQPQGTAHDLQWCPQFSIVLNKPLKSFLYVQTFDFGFVDPQQYLRLLTKHSTEIMLHSSWSSVSASSLRIVVAHQRMIYRTSEPFATHLHDFYTLDILLYFGGYCTALLQWLWGSLYANQVSSKWHMPCIRTDTANRHI